MKHAVPLLFFLTADTPPDRITAADRTGILRRQRRFRPCADGCISPLPLQKRFQPRRFLSAKGWGGYFSR